jgi:hypothetical protein
MADSGGAGMTVADYLHSKNLSADELAAVLSERLNRTITAAAVIAQGDKPMRKAWLMALGIKDAPEPVVEEIIEEVTGEKPKRKATRAPAEPAEFNPFLVEQRVAAIYSMVGRGVSAATKEPRYATAFNAHADKCGKAWADLAQYDKHVATVLTALTAGGPWGEVIWLHASLGFSLVVISGKVDIGNLGIIPGASSATSDAKPDEAPTDDGTGDASPPHPLG